MAGGVEQGGGDARGASRRAEGIQKRRGGVVVRQGFLDGEKPSGGLVGEGVQPTPEGTGGGGSLRGALLGQAGVGSPALVAGGENLPDDGQEIVAEVQEEAGQAGSGMVAALAAPPLNGDPVDVGLVQGFARVEAVADEAVVGLADGADGWSGEDEAVELGGVLMDGATEVYYNRHVVEPDPRKCRQADRLGSGSSFLLKSSAAVRPPVQAEELLPAAAQDTRTPGIKKPPHGRPKPSSPLVPPPNSAACPQTSAKESGRPQHTARRTRGGSGGGCPQAVSAGLLRIHWFSRRPPGGTGRPLIVILLGALSLTG